MEIRIPLRAINHGLLKVWEVVIQQLHCTLQSTTVQAAIPALQLATALPGMVIPTPPRVIKLR